MNHSFDNLNQNNATQWIEWLDAESPSECLDRLSHLDHCLLLESAMLAEEVGRYSFLMADPVSTFSIANDSRPQFDIDPFAEVRHCLESFEGDPIDGLPPFQGGAAGLLSYELNGAFERVVSASDTVIPVPKMLLGVYDVVIAWDHVLDRCWIISQGFPATESSQRSAKAAQRLSFFAKLLSKKPTPTQTTRDRRTRLSCPVQQHPVTKLESASSNLTEQQYLSSIEKIIEYIHAGDIFQVNFAQSLLLPAETDSISLYRRLRSCNPAPFAGYFDLGDVQVLSASPERFISLRDGLVQTRPIKGTRRRTRFPEADLPTSLQLQTSEKDRAENIMIVDLLRNDLSQVCEDASVEVKQLCGVESFRSVLHLVSVIEGRLLPDRSVFDLLRASFPGGSISGAPKVRAMEIIAELEPTARGAYCGCLGYVGFDGTSDFNILIRTLTANQDWWQIPVGGGIVADSDPHREYEETWTKAAGMLRATQAESVPIPKLDNELELI